MKRVDQLIASIRERTRNLNYSRDNSTGAVLEGISDDLILAYMNEAQDHLQAKILSVYPNEFVATQTTSLVGNQEAYTITGHLFINNKIISVEYSNSGNETDYVPLDQGTFRDRKTYTGYPNFYIRRGNTILLNPIPQSSRGTIRITYYRELDDVCTRKALVSAASTTSTAVTSITVDTTYTDHDQFALADADYICVNDRYGNVTMYNIPIDSYTNGTGIISIYGGSYAFASGESIAVGSYVTTGRYASTQSALPDNCERYLTLYTQKRILVTDESNTSIEEDAELQQVKDDIINSFADESRDVQWIPILDPELLL